MKLLFEIAVLPAGVTVYTVPLALTAKATTTSAKPEILRAFVTKRGRLSVRAPRSVDWVVVWRSAPNGDEQIVRGQGCRRK
jgi:hypothetical protein